MKTLFHSLVLTTMVMASCIFGCRDNSRIDAITILNQHLDSINRVRRAGIKLKITDGFIDTIGKLKKELIEASGGWIDQNGNRHMDGEWSPEKGKLFDEINLTVSSKIMIEKGNGNMLFYLIQETRTRLLSLVHDSIKRAILSVQIPLAIHPASLGELNDSTWAYGNFELVSSPCRNYAP